MTRFNSYDYAFLIGLLCGADYMQKNLQQEIEAEMRREAETFNRFVQLKNRAHELAAMLWAAIKTIRDQDTRRKVISTVDAGFARLEARDQQRRQG